MGAVILLSWASIFRGLAAGAVAIAALGGFLLLIVWGEVWYPRGTDKDQDI